MKKLSILMIVAYFFVGCTNQPNQNQRSVGKMINSFEDSSEPYAMLPQAALFYPNGALLDIRIGTIPYYWYSMEQGKTFTRPPTTMMLFETKQKYVAQDEEKRSLIQRISFGENELSKNVKTEEALEAKINENIKKFITALEKMRKVELVIKATEQKPENSVPVNSADGGASNDSVNVIDPSVPYIVFSFNETNNDIVNLNAPLDIVKVSSNKKKTNKRYFAALYPSVYTLNPSHDLKEYMEILDRKLNDINYNKDADCDGFMRFKDDRKYYIVNDKVYYKNKGEEVEVDSKFFKLLDGKIYYKNGLVKERNGNCPYAKHWLVNYLLTAKAIIYLDSQEAKKLSSGSLKVNDNSLSSIEKWMEKGFQNGQYGEMKIESNTGKSTSLNTVYSGKKVEVDDLAWSCLEKGKKCLPSGGKEGKDGSNEIPIFAIFNLDSGQYAKMIEKAPYQDFSIPMQHD